MKHETILAGITVLILIFALALVSVAESSSDNTGCAELETRHGYTCCKDFNRNAICDIDEVFFEKQEVVRESVFSVSHDNQCSVLKEFQKRASANNLLTWEAEKKLEDEQRDIEKKRRNWERTIDNKYVFGYDSEYDPRVH